jgi:hypothetical protein
MPDGLVHFFGDDLVLEPGALVADPCVASDDGAGDLYDIEDVDSDVQAIGLPLPKCDDSALTTHQLRDLILRALI